MSDEHADGIGGESHWLFKEIESLKYWAVVRAADVLVEAVGKGVDAEQGLKWMVEALTPQRIWEEYLRAQEYRMEEQITAAISEVTVVRKAKGKVWHRIYDHGYTLCAAEYDDGWVRGELPATPLCGKCGTGDRDDRYLRRKITHKRMSKVLRRNREDN